MWLLINADIQVKPCQYKRGSKSHHNMVRMVRFLQNSHNRPPHLLYHAMRAYGLCFMLSNSHTYSTIATAAFHIILHICIYTVQCHYNAVNFLQNSHKGHSFGMSFVSLKSDLSSAAATGLLDVIHVSWYIASCYNGTGLYIYIYIWHYLTVIMRLNRINVLMVKGCRCITKHERNLSNALIFCFPKGKREFTIQYENNTRTLFIHLALPQVHEIPMKNPKMCISPFTVTSPVVLISHRHYLPCQLLRAGNTTLINFNPILYK